VVGFTEPAKTENLLAHELAKELAGKPACFFEETTMAKKSDAATAEEKLPSMERDILKDLREKMSSGGASGFKLRVTKKLANSGGYTFVGNIDGNVENIDEELLNQWKDGVYHVYAHYLDNRRVPNVPPMEYVVGNPETIAAAAKTDAKGSKCIEQIDEEIEMKRKERELRKAERELHRLEQEDNGDGEDEGVMAMMHDFERELDKLREENEKLKHKTVEDRLMSEIADLKKKFDDDGPRNKQRDPEIEALKARLVAAEDMARKAEMESMKRGFEGQTGELKALLTNQQNGNKWGAKDYAAAAAPFIPAVTAYIEKATGGRKEALEIVEKMTGVFKNQPKGMELKEIIPLLTPIVMPFLTRKDDSIPAILGLVGNLVGPMVEAAAEAAHNPPSGDDLGNNIQKVIGLIQKSLSDGKDIQNKNLEIEKVRAKTAERMASRLPPRPPPRGIPGAPPPRALSGAPQQPQQQAQPQRQPQRPPSKPATGTTPFIRFVNKVGQAITEQDEEVEFYVGLAEKELPQEDLTRLEKYTDASMLAAYLGGMPGVDSSMFQTVYGKRWLLTFIKFFHGETLTPAVKPPASPPVPPVAKPRPPEPVAPASNVVQMPPRNKNDVPGNLKLNEFAYPEDSQVDVVTLEDMELPIEYPTPETVAKREAERLAVMETVGARE